MLRMEAHRFCHAMLNHQIVGRTSYARCGEIDDSAEFVASMWRQKCNLRMPALTSPELPFKRRCQLGAFHETGLPTTFRMIALYFPLFTGVLAQWELRLLLRKGKFLTRVFGPSNRHSVTWHRDGHIPIQHLQQMLHILVVF